MATNQKVAKTTKKANLKVVKPFKQRIINDTIERPVDPLILNSKPEKATMQELNRARHSNEATKVVIAQKVSEMKAGEKYAWPTAYQRIAKECAHAETSKKFKISLKESAKGFFKLIRLY